MSTIDSRIWLLSVCLAIFIHGLVLLQWGNQWGPSQSIKSYPVHSTRLSFNKVLVNDAVLPKLEPLRVRQEQKKNVPTTKHKIRKNTRQKKKRLKPVEKKMPAMLADRPENKEKQENNVVSSAASVFLKQQREDYFKQLISHIEKYKFYPGSARRRGIEGKVAISFVLNADGGISGLTVISEYRALKQAAAEAIKSALPMPLPATQLTGTKEIAFNMLYAMK